ncbi:hypothetical protein WNY78_15665 [Psychroserpens sp. AS72]
MSKKYSAANIGIFAPTYEKQSENNPSRNDDVVLLGANNGRFL